MFEATEFFASFSVDDISVAKQFYAGTLGLDVGETDVGPQWMRELWLQLAGERRVMIYPKPDHTPATCTVLNFTVDDIGLLLLTITPPAGSPWTPSMPMSLMPGESTGSAIIRSPGSVTRPGTSWPLTKNTDFPPMPGGASRSTCG